MSAFSTERPSNATRMTDCWREVYAKLWRVKAGESKSYSKIRSVDNET